MHIRGTLRTDRACIRGEALVDIAEGGTVGELLVEEPSEARLEMGQAEVAAAVVAGLMGAEGGQEAHLKSTQRKEIDESLLIPKTVTQ